MINFKGKKILITGATGGIGHALVKKFLSLEGTVLATGTNTEKLDALKKEFPNINVLKFDISQHSKIGEFIENVSSQLVGLDILVNNAGISMRALFSDLDIFCPSFVHQPCAKILFGSSTFAAIRKAGQYTAWKRKMSFPTICIAGQNFLNFSFSVSGYPNDVR